jgi:hydroxymethylbilane synthase
MILEKFLISRDGAKLQETWRSNSIIGTSSFRREFQIKRLKENISCKLIRGNVDTRLRKLKEGLYDAIILSLAGIQISRVRNRNNPNIFN